MHASFRSCARSSSKAVLGFFLMSVPLLLGQNTAAPVEADKELPDAPMPVTTAPATPSNLNLRHGALPPSFDANSTQTGSWMGKSPAVGRPALKANPLTFGENRFDAKGLKGAGKPVVNWFEFDPDRAHANRTATHGATQWYTSHIPWVGPIMRRGLKISKAHPHLTTVIKTLKPQL